MHRRKDFLRLLASRGRVAKIVCTLAWGLGVPHSENQIATAELAATSEISDVIPLTRASCVPIQRVAIVKSPYPTLAAWVVIQDSSQYRGTLVAEGSERIGKKRLTLVGFGKIGRQWAKHGNAERSEKSHSTRDGLGTFAVTGQTAQLPAQKTIAPIRTPRYDGESGSLVAVLVAFIRGRGLAEWTG